MKKYILVIIILAIIALALALVVATSMMKKNSIGKGVYIIKEESFYSDYSIENDTVKLYYEFAIANNTDSVQSFRIKATFEKDVGRLIKSSELFGINCSTDNDVFTLNPGEKTNYRVMFKDSYAGINQKYDRALPYVEVQPVQLSHN